MTSERGPNLTLLSVLACIGILGWSAKKPDSTSRWMGGASLPNWALQQSPCLDLELDPKLLQCVLNVHGSNSFVCGKNCLNFDKLGSKCSSRKVQQNCAISF
jgi:hypothetical protein